MSRELTIDKRLTETEAGIGNDHSNKLGEVTGWPSHSSLSSLVLETESPSTKAGTGFTEPYSSPQDYRTRLIDSCVTWSVMLITLELAW